MRIVIVGAGSVGFQVAKQLVDEGKTVTVIEQDQDSVKYIANRIDCMVVHGGGNDIAALKEAGCDKADYLIALTGSDEINMIICSLVAANFPQCRKFARISSHNYIESIKANQQYLGIDHIISPDLETARSIIRHLDRGAQTQSLVFENVDLEIRDYMVPPQSRLVGKSINDISHSVSNSFLVPVIQRGTNAIIPSGEQVIQKGDRIFIAAAGRELAKIFEQLGSRTRDIRKVLVVGGGSIARSVLTHLHHGPTKNKNILKRIGQALAHTMGTKRIRVIERNYQKCKELTSLFPEALIIHADITEENILEEEQLNDSDVLVTATENPELNIMVALYAKKIGIPRAITLVKTENYARIASQLDINVAVSMKHTVVNSIVKHIKGSNVSSIHSMAEGQIEALELTVGKNNQLHGIHLSQAKLPAETLILAVLRQGKTYIPDGNTRVQEGDQLLIITRKNQVPQMEQIMGINRP